MLIRIIRRVRIQADDLSGLTYLVDFTCKIRINLKNPYSKKDDTVSDRMVYRRHNGTDTLQCRLVIRLMEVGSSGDGRMRRGATQFFLVAEAVPDLQVGLRVERVRPQDVPRRRLDRDRVACGGL